METETKPKTYRQACVRVTQGNRRMSDFMANAGLGLTGAGYAEVFTIDYKPGEVVDEDRVKKAMDEMIAESERLQTEFKILGYKVLGVETVETQE